MNDQDAIVDLKVAMSRLSAVLELQGEQVKKNGAKSEEIYTKVIGRIDQLDDKWAKKFEALERIVEEDVRNLAALENKGKGIFTALTLFFTTLGAALTALYDKIFQPL